MTKPFLLLGLTLILVAAAATAETWSVKLADGTTHEGQFIRLEAGRYLLQTEGTLLELTEDDIDPVTFESRTRADAAPTRKLVETRHYDELHADQTATQHWEMHLVNDSRKAITELRFGYAPWERKYADQRTYRDPFGNVLVPEYDPPRRDWSRKPDQRVQLSISLPVPVAPGETMTINGSETSPTVRRTEDGLHYVNVGDYAEDRLVWLKVRLPFDARIQRISPEPTARFEQDGFEFVMWRRFYARGERIPLEIVYTLD